MYSRNFNNSSEVDVRIASEKNMDILATQSTSSGYLTTPASKRSYKGLVLKRRSPKQSDKSKQKKGTGLDNKLVQYYL